MLSNGYTEAMNALVVALPAPRIIVSGATTTWTWDTVPVASSSADFAAVKQIVDRFSMPVETFYISRKTWVAIQPRRTRHIINALDRTRP